MSFQLIYIEVVFIHLLTYLFCWYVTAVHSDSIYHGDCGLYITLCNSVFAFDLSHPSLLFSFWVSFPFSELHLHWWFIFISFLPLPFPCFQRFVSLPIWKDFPISSSCKLRVLEGEAFRNGSGIFMNGISVHLWRGMRSLFSLSSNHLFSLSFTREQRDKRRRVITEKEEEPHRPFHLFTASLWISYSPELWETVFVV